ncbi:sensor domain-containing protein [Aquihabitans sp. McL0605]|uniref:sensor domain-containing protein n=1 Tax=Aquihabitans sp. McL0605 TaxID=3415671 RepID=UPI003CF853AE
MGGTGERGEVAASERWFRSLLSNISDTVSITDGDGKLLFSSGTDNNLLGYPDDFWLGRQPISLVHPDDMDRAVGGWERALANPGMEVYEEVRMREANGTWQDIAITGVNLIDDPEVGGIVVTSRNITDLRRAQRLSTSQASVLELIARGESLTTVGEACVQLLVDNGFSGNSAIYLLEEDRLEIRAGSAPAALVEWMREAERSIDRSLCDRAILTEDAVIVSDVRAATLAEGLGYIAANEDIKAAWSQPILSIASGRPVGSLSTLYDEIHVPSEHERHTADVACSLVAIALERADTEAQLAHQALHDGLTGLPNRTLLLDRLDHALARRERTGTDIALLFCDIDRFKVVNDSMGHNVGDQLLVAFAQRFRSVVAPSDTVARFGGDEFVVLIEDVTTDDHPVRVAEELAEALAHPFLLPAGNEVFLTVSIGLALATDHRSGDGWLRDADAAMYRAKEAGRNRLAAFDTDMRDAAMIRLQIESDLRRAVERDELVVHYQPVIDLVTGRISGAEALVRWQHPERGLLPPGDFIEVAEDTGTINGIGRHVLETAVREISRLVDHTRDRPFQLGVNVSARQLSSGDLDELVRSVLAGSGWPGPSLLLELTESALLHGLDEPIGVMRRLHDLGVSLAIDDFGTGYSSLARLGHLPVDQVKIDQSFVGAIGRPDDRLGRIVDAVIAIAVALDHRTTAEGVETDAQLDYLRRMRCDYAQGFLFSKPLPFDEFAALLESDPRW